MQTARRILQQSVLSSHLSRRNQCGRHEGRAAGLFKKRRKEENVLMVVSKRAAFELQISEFGQVAFGYFRIIFL
jgi:hypothetical protein